VLTVAGIILKSMYHLFVLEFWEFSTENSAQNIFFNARLDTENWLSGGVSSQSYVNLPRFNRFTRTAHGRHVVLSRIDNTYVLMIGSAENRAVMNDIISELGH